MPRLDPLLHQLVERGASDLHLASGFPIKMRICGELEVVCPQLTTEECTLLLRELVTEAQWETFGEQHDLDFSYELEGVLRVRASYLQTARGVAAVFRAIPEGVRGAEELGLPAAALELATIERGLVLVTGPTGSGKSTTLAAMIDHINRRCARHIILLEDPIEFVHNDIKSFIVQREIGTHASDFPQALRAAVRQDPDVIMVGELRDAQTMSLALEAAEMGYAVFGTLHTSSAAKTVDRILGLFGDEHQPRARMALADVLQGVVSQQLLRRIGGRERVAVHEILINTGAIANMIRAGESAKIASAMQTGGRLGMQRMDQALMQALRGGLIDAREAFARADDKDRFAPYLTAS